MTKLRRFAGVLAVLSAVLAVEPAIALEVPLTVTETAGVARVAEPVTTGVPLAKGAVKDLASLRLVDEKGAALPAQFRALAPWPDGSVRVVLVDTQVSVPANGSVKLKLADGAAAGGAGGGVIRMQARDGDGPNVVGEVQVEVRGGGPLPRKVVINGTELVPVAAESSAPGPKIGVEDGPDAITLDTGAIELAVSKKKFNLFQSVKVAGKEVLPAGARIVLTTEDGKQITTADVEPAEVKIEELGSLRAVILARGRFADALNKLIGYRCRITAYAGKPYVKVSFWLESEGRYGWVGKGEWFVFDGLSIELPAKATSGALDVRVDNETGKGDAKAFSFTGGDNKGQVSLKCPEAAVNVAVKDFWQNYPKGLRVKDGTLSIDLWPAWGHWPRKCPGTTCNEGVRKAGFYSFPGGMRKRHEMIFEFAAPDKPAEMKSTAAVLDHPLMLLASSQYYADTDALTPFAPAEFKPADADAARQVARWTTWARNVIDPKNPKSIEGCRRTCGYGPSYGVIDFGDFFWAEGVTSLHYDWPWIMLLNYVRLGDRGFFDYGAEMVKHRIDVDQVWADREEFYFRGLTRFEMGFVDIHGGNNDGHYKPIATHNWTRGPLWWYYLTGDESARECVIRNCEVGIKLRQVDNHADDTDGKRLGDQTRGSGWSIGCLADAYDLTGDKKFLDWAGVLWKNHLRALWKQKGPNYGMTGPNVLQFYYPTHDLVLLHQRNGDPELLEYMRDLCKYCDDPANWSKYQDDMAINMTNFYGYLGCVDKDAKRMARARELFAKGLPPKDDRLILWSGSGAYTKEAGKPLRNGHIWLWAERKLAGNK